MENVREILEKSEKVKPIAEVNGTKLTTFENQVVMATADQVNDVGLSPVEFNPDGSIAATPTKWAAVNTEMFFNNRFREKDGEYHVVSALKDYESIKGLDTGRMPYKQIQADVVVSDNGKPKYKTSITVTDTEFVAEFTKKFSEEDMAKILPIIMNGAGREPDAEKSIFK